MLLLRVLGWVLAGAVVVFTAIIALPARELLPAAVVAVAGPFLYGLLLLSAAIIVVALIVLDAWSRRPR